VETVAPRWRSWLARGAFEATLILFGLLGAFALNEWQEARQRADRADAMIAAIRAELMANLEVQEQAATYNTQLVDTLKKLRDAGETFVPANVYRGGLIKRPKLTEAAWTTAQNGGVLQEVPVNTILVLARIYESQRDYQDATGALLETLYAAALSRDTPYRGDGAEGAPQLAGVLSDFASRGAALVRDYRWVLAYLDGAPPASPASEPATAPATAEPAATTPEPDTAAAQRP
jgi:type II secretory pathway pseudopilin PulG